VGCNNFNRNVGEKGWERMREKLPREFSWKVQWAKKRNKKGRAKGGMMMGVRKELESKEEENWKEKEGIGEKYKDRKWMVEGGRSVYQ